MKSIVHAITLSLIVACIIVGCKGVDVDNGVSNSNYRLVLNRGLTNLNNIKAHLVAAEKQDLAVASPIHSAAWWDVEVQVVSETATLFDATLKGATYTAGAQ